MNRYLEHDKVRRAVLEMEKSNPSIWGPMQYPGHPFPPEVCDKMSLFPPGIIAFCLARVVSYPVINVMSLICEALFSEKQHRVVGGAGRGDRMNAAMCFRLLQAFPLSLAERVLLLSISSYCYFRAGDPASWQNVDGFIQMSCLRAMSQPQPGGDMKALLWEAMVLRAAFGYDTPAREYSGLLYRQVMKTDPQLFARRYEVAKEFFWDRGLTEILENVPFDVSRTT